MARIKPFLSHTEQVELLISRGMHISNPRQAEEKLSTLNYYRLSGYWYSMRQVDPVTKNSLNAFRPGASFELAVALYDFDESLRQAIFADLVQIELAMRALIGYHLGKIDPLIHLSPDKLGAAAKQRKGRGKNSEYQVWATKYDSALEASREGFVRHHRKQYDGILPVWVAVEIMDWGMLSHLYRMSPLQARNEIAQVCNLRAPQLESWLKCLNILRNYVAHHARVFNRTFDIKPKLSQDLRLSAIANCTNRVFAQLTLIHYLQDELQLPRTNRLNLVVDSFANNDLVPFERLGAPSNWRELELWR